MGTLSVILSEILDFKNLDWVKLLSKKGLKNIIKGDGGFYDFVVNRHLYFFAKLNVFSYVEN